jgi:Anti-sigma-K factor rskA
MTCDDARAELIAGDAVAATAHIASCRSCQADQAPWLKWRAVLMEPSTWEEPSARVAEWVFDRAGSTSSEPAAKRVSRRSWVAAAVLLVVLGGAFALVTERTPDWTIPLVAVGGDPANSAIVDGWNTATGTRLQLRISGIAPAPPGHYYEIWLTALDGRHVSAGSFQAAGTVSAWAGVSRSEFPRIWITLEAMGDDLGPSPTTYFDTVG